jgi:hypothetical protein
MTVAPLAGNRTVDEIFIRRLEICEQSNFPWSAFDKGFLKSLRELYDSREDAEDYGGEPWTPSPKQWNYLMSIWEKQK